LLLLLNLATAASLHAATLPRLHPASPWYQRIDQAAVHPDSAGPAGMIATLGGLGGFGNGRMQIDFSMHVLYATAGTPTQPLIEIPSADPNDDYYLPDCDALGTPIPLPVGGAIEGQAGYSCDVFGNDCHLLVVTGNEIFEVYRANVTASGVESQCLARWRMDALYPPQGRGEHCTSADAAGFPVAPLLFNADEVAAAVQLPDGDLGHAIRFILPNNRMASDAALGGVLGRLYVRPASHAGGPSGPSASVPYGARLRLRSDFPMAGYNAAAQVILRTMQRYGIVLADGGTVALTAESDRYTSNTWAGLGIGSRVFDQTPGAQDVLISDFAVLDTGPRIGETYDCVRSQPELDPLFANGFE
jgi:serine/threonine-protein kinase